VQCDGKLDHTQPGPEVSAGDRYRVNGLAAQLIGDLTQLARVKLTQIFGAVDQVKQRGL